jgi:hypothetical protein
VKGGRRMRVSGCWKAVGGCGRLASRTFGFEREDLLDRSHRRPCTILGCVRESDELIYDQVAASKQR